MSSHVAKKLKSTDLAHAYKESYSEEFDWTDILTKELLAYLDVLEKACGCPITMSVSAMLPLTACLAGPNTRIEAQTSEAYASSLNMYVFSVCDPGGGKSMTFDNILMPVIDHLKKIHNLSIGFVCSRG